MLNKKKLSETTRIFFCLYLKRSSLKIGKNLEMKQKFWLSQMIFSCLASKMLEIRLKNLPMIFVIHSFIENFPSKKYVLFFRLPYHDSQKMCVSISFWWKWQSLEQEVRKKLGGKTRFFSQESQSLEFCWKEDNFLIFLKILIR